MEQGEETRVKTLRERFQNDESSNMRIKPAIPEKPKTIPPISPTAKISNPLIASINSAVENRLAPRVVFKDDKKTRPVTQPEPAMVKAKPILLDKNQKKEADLIKQALKDRKILPTSPVSPVFEQKPKSESIQKSPGLETPVKVLTPFKKATLNKPDKDQIENTDFSKWDVPLTPLQNHSDSSTSPQARTEATVKKPLVPPVTANPTISPPVISRPAFSPSNPPAVTVPQPVHQNGPQMENTRPETPIRHNSNVITPPADFFEDSSPEDEMSIPESPDITVLDIPPPIIPTDFSNGPSDLEMSPRVTPEPRFPRTSLYATPVFQSPASTHPYSDSVFTFSPSPERSSPPVNFDSSGENRLAESPKMIDSTEKPLEVPASSSPMAASVVSALARAEEMAPAKHSACDQRLLNLLEKAKRKSTGGSQLSTPEILPALEKDLPSNFPLESSPPETLHPEPVSHVEAPNIPEPLNLLDIPPIDYEGKAERAAKEINTQPHELSLNNQDQGKTSPIPKMVIVQKPAVPPPPPPRKPRMSVPNGGLTPEKPPQPPSKDRMSIIQPSLPLEENGITIGAPPQFTSVDSRCDVSETLDLPERLGTPDNTLDHGTPVPSVHEGAFFEHLNLQHQNPNMDITDPGLPKTPLTTDLTANSFSSPAVISPPGPQFSFNNTEFEDMTTSKKSKVQKKQRKGSPMNPYAETPMTEETPKKVLFSKKNSQSSVEKEQKMKDKKSQKDKEKEKEKEKEQKEKEKEKKEQKEKKKEDKEKDKKELKEREKEKKEQKEREKKENEMKKKFKITGDEEALYQSRVIETIKGRKDDLAVKAGDIVSIMRTTDCPKGKWLARDSTNKYGYIPLKSVELNIQDMMVLGNKAKANNNRLSINGIIDPNTPSSDIMSSHHYSINQESFEDDSEEWCDDDDDVVFQPDHGTDIVLNQQSFPDSGPKTDPGLPAHTDRSDNAHGGREALHKLSTFFAQPAPILPSNTPIKEPVLPAVRTQEPINSLKQEVELQILPPPDLYADIAMG